MKEYRPTYEVYGDIYDFDDINGISNTSEAYDKAHISSNLNWSHIADNRVHLPSIDGQCALEKTPRVRAVLDYHHEAAAAGITNKVVDLDRGKKPLYVARHGQRIAEYAETTTRPTRLPDISDGKVGQRQHILEYAEHDEIYRTLMEGVQDKSLLERSPQVIEYERRNRIKRLDCPKHHVITENFDQPPRNNRKRYEEVMLSNLKADHGTCHLPDIHQKPCQDSQKPSYQPMPPMAPRPDTVTKASYRNRRRFRNSNTSHAQDTQQVLHHVPKLSLAEEEINHEKKVLDALRAKKQSDRLQKELEEKNKFNMMYGMEFRPTTAATANTNLTGCSTPQPNFAHAVLSKSAKPAKTCSDDHKRKEAGFKLKTKREKQNANIDVGSMPVSIKKKMKKYFS